MTGSTIVRPTLVLLCAALGLTACGGSETTAAASQTGGAEGKLFSRANQNNDGYKAIRQSFDRHYTRCGDSLVTKATTINTWKKYTNSVTRYYEVDDLDFAVIEADVPPVDQKNGVEFVGLAVFSDATLYRMHEHVIAGKLDENRGWSDWKTVGFVTESELDGTSVDIDAWPEYSGGKFQKQIDVWTMDGVMTVPFIEAAEVTRRNEVTTFEKPDCAEVPKE